MFWGNYISLIGATIFILVGLVLLVDFAHSWSETCLHNWEESDSSLWQFILIGSSLGLYAAAITMTGVLYGFFAGSGCTMNRFFISFNLALCVVITIMSIHPAIQEANPRSGLSQSSMVVAYCTYLITSAVANHTHATCNPLHNGSGSATRSTAAVLGAAFTFLAIAYSTTRAATQSRALVGNAKRGGKIQLSSDGDHEIGVINTQPSRKDTPRYQAILAAVEAGYGFLKRLYCTVSLLNGTVVRYLLLLWMKISTMRTTRSLERKGMMRKLPLVITCAPVLLFSYVPTNVLHSTLGFTLSSSWRQCTSPCFSRTGESLSLSPQSLLFSLWFRSDTVCLMIVLCSHSTGTS